MTRANLKPAMDSGKGNSAQRLPKPQRAVAAPARTRLSINRRAEELPI